VQCTPTSSSPIDFNPVEWSHLKVIQYNLVLQSFIDWLALL
jgi:hypothetical protein